MFRGPNRIHLDAKGRLAIPGCYREALASRCDGHLVATVNVVTRMVSGEKCLLIYPLDEWRKAERKVAALPDANRDHQNLKRFFLGYACDLEMDKNGRVLLPKLLREFAELNRETVLSGRVNKFELWSEALWNAARDAWLSEPPDKRQPSVELEQLVL